MSLVDVQGLAAAYGGPRVLEDVGFTLAAGERKFDIDIDWLTGRVAIAP